MGRSLFISGLLHNFYSVKVKETWFTEGTLHLIKYFSLKNANIKIEVGITVAKNWLLNKLVVRISSQIENVFLK